jgi:hypothetical protein
LETWLQDHISLQHHRSGDLDRQSIQFDRPKPFKHWSRAAAASKQERVGFHETDVSTGRASDPAELRLGRIIVETHDLGIAPDARTPVRLGAADRRNPGAEGEIGTAEAEPGEGEVNVSFHEVVGSGKVVERESAWFQDADDLRHRRLVVEDMFEDLVAETEVERAILERQPIVGRIGQLQPIGDFSGGLVADEPVLVEITVPYSSTSTP